MTLTHPTFNTTTSTVASNRSSSQQYDRGTYLIRTNQGHNFFVHVPAAAAAGNSSSKSSMLTTPTHWPMETTSQQAQEILVDRQLQQQQDWKHYRNHVLPTVCINGGPFDGDGWSSGPIVINGTFQRTKSSSINDTELVGIGIITKTVVTTTTTTVDTNNTTHDTSFSSSRTKDTTFEWVLGTYPDIQQTVQERNQYNSRNLRHHHQQRRQHHEHDDHLGLPNTTSRSNDMRSTVHQLKYFVSGFDWLVYNDKNVVDEGTTKNKTKKRRIEPSAERAPRTVIGIGGLTNKNSDNNKRNNGELMLLVVDGCERCWHRRGPTLSEIADLLIAQGANYAINMDGGGSSTIVMHDDDHHSRDQWTESSSRSSSKEATETIRRCCRTRTRSSTSTTTTIENKTLVGINHWNYNNTRLDDWQPYYTVINHPTCLDVVPIQCERRVASVVCV